jgi:DNA-binding CsgD family transcriptional regulator
VDERLARASRSGLLRTEPDGLYSFSHDKIRECLYDEVSPARRRRLHGVIGRVLEGRASASSADGLAALAFHFARSGDAPRGADYARRAAEQSLAAYAAEQALELYQAALELLDASDPTRGDLLLASGDAALLANAGPAAEAAFAAAREWFSAAGDLPAAARAGHRLGQALWRREAVEEARAALIAATALIEDRPGPDLVRVLVDLGTLLAVSLGRPAEGINHARRALDLAGRLGDPRLEAAASRTVGNLFVRANDIDSGLPLLEHALALASAADDAAEAAECCACLVVAHYWSGNPRGIMASAQQQIVWAERSHDLYQLRHVYSWLAASFTHYGEWSEAQAMLAKAEAVVTRLDRPEPRAMLEQMRGWMALWHGDFAAAEEPLQAAIAIYRAHSPAQLVWHLGAVAIAQLGQSKRDEALACLAELETILAGFPADSTATLEALSCLGMATVMLGDPERAALVYPRLQPFSGKLSNYLIDRILGRLATLLRDWHAAHEYLAAAEEFARREELPSEYGHALVAQADLEIARGGRGAARRGRDLLAGALEVFERIGWEYDAAYVRTRLFTLPRPRATRRKLPFDLSEREAEVLRLVAAGKSNRQIAAELFISDKTVANHLSSIYAKTGVENRVAAAAFALRHGLAEGSAE